MSATTAVETNPAETNTAEIALTVNGQRAATSTSTRARRCSTRCASTCT